MISTRTRYLSSQKITGYLLSLPEGEYTVRELEDAITSHFQLGMCDFISHRAVICEGIESLPYFFWQRCARLPSGDIYLSEKE